MLNKISLAILEDHQSIIDGYLYRLGKYAHIEVPVIATTAAELEALLAAHRVDVLLLDVNVPIAPDDPNPYPILHFIPKWLQKYPRIAVLVISVHKSGTIIKSVMQAGASGYICKDDNATIQNLGAVIQTIASGGMYLSEQPRRYLLKTQAQAAELTPRQLQALTLCAAYPDSTSGELAERLDVAHSTFRNLLSEAYLKLGVHSRAAAIARARQQRLIPPLVPEEDPFESP
jgi:DNA-binding NarL/FixJ family response regulator